VHRRAGIEVTAQRGQRFVEWYVGAEVVQPGRVDRAGLDHLGVEGPLAWRTPGEAPVGGSGRERQDRIGQLLGSATAAGRRTHATSQ
jgi:hypothetical protein